MSPTFPRKIENLENPSEAQVETLLALDRSDQSARLLWQNQNEQWGLFPVYIPTAEVRASLPVTHDTDIIAVHGFGGDVHRTWEHENGFNWLHHVYEQFPGVRIYSYGYDSGMAFTFKTSGLTNYARHLLSVIKLTRNDTNVRSIPSR
jgi:hypothetical protein